MNNKAIKEILKQVEQKEVKHPSLLYTMDFGHGMEIRIKLGVN